MATELPYMHSATNLSGILDRIRSAATPPKFTHEFLKSNLGFGSSNDRSVIKVLKQLKFLTADAVPTERYNAYRGHSSGRPIADGLREGWGPLFLSDERVYEKSGTELEGIVKNVTGSGDAVAKKVAKTFKTLAEKADWTESSDESQLADSDETSVDSRPSEDEASSTSAGALRLHHDIHLHLPPTSDVGVYRAIFKAMKSELL